MAHILHIDVSPRGDRSISRSLAKEFLVASKTANADDTVSYRDLGHYPVPPVDESWIAAAFSPPDTVTPEMAAALNTSNELIEEFLAADKYIIGLPMYNFSIPSTFKAYLDQILRANRTFKVNPDGSFAGLVHNKKALFITTRGGAYPAGTPYAQYDFQEPYIRTAFGFIGVTDVTFINAEGLNMGPEIRQKALESARTSIQELAKTW